MGASGDDAELLEAWRNGDRDAGGTLIDRHFKAMYRFFQSKVDGSDVDDLVQQTFEACVKGRDRFRGDATMRTYLYAVARRKLCDFFSAKMKRNVDFGVSSIVDCGPTPRSMLSIARRDHLLLQALTRIPVDAQIAIELHYWQGLTGPQLAEVLEIPEPAVRSRLRRGLERLRKRIAELQANGDVPETVEDLEAWAKSLRSAVNE